MRLHNSTWKWTGVAAGLLGAAGLAAVAVGDFGAGVPAAVGAPRGGRAVSSADQAVPPQPTVAVAAARAAASSAVSRKPRGSRPRGGSRVTPENNAPSQARYVAGGVAAPDNAPAGRRTPTSTVVVRGSWINDGQCLPTALKGGPTTFDITCTGTSQWDGALTGREVAHIVGTIDVEGNMFANYEAWFTGTYIVDHTVGGFHEFGTVAVDGATLGFQAHARIVSGSCGFAGSTGRFDFDGNAETGGYTGTWTRPTTTPATNAPCVPDLPRVN